MLIYPLPLGEGVEFQNEARVLEIRGEGEKTLLILLHPHPIFLMFVPHIEKLPSPLKGEGMRTFITKEF